MNVKYANFDKYLSVAIIAEKYLKFLDLLSFKSAKWRNFLVCLFVCLFVWFYSSSIDSESNQTK